MTAWKNLHFRPPILKPLKPFKDSRFSDKILIRDVPTKKVVLGYIVLRSYDDSFYHMVVSGLEETEMIDEFYEWTEVPT